MVSQYPHSMNVTLQNGNSTQDDNGNWMVPTNEITMNNLPCRAEPNSNSFITLADGSKYSFAFKVYMPIPDDDIPVGADILITDANAQVVATGKVKQFFRGQLNCRLWL